jgi:hypothetical protein
MKITIEFETDNAAFEGELFGGELKKVLNQARLKVLRQRHRPPALCEHLESMDKLLDTNGNTVGTVEVKK